MVYQTLSLSGQHWQQHVSPQHDNHELEEIVDCRIRKVEREKLRKMISKEQRGGRHSRLLIWLLELWAELCVGCNYARAGEGCALGKCWGPLELQEPARKCFLRCVKLQADPYLCQAVCVFYRSPLPW